MNNCSRGIDDSNVPLLQAGSFDFCNSGRFCQRVSLKVMKAGQPTRACKSNRFFYPGDGSSSLNKDA